MEYEHISLILYMYIGMKTERVPNHYQFQVREYGGMELYQYEHTIRMKTERYPNHYQCNHLTPGLKKNKQPSYIHVLILTHRTISTLLYPLAFNLSDLIKHMRYLI